MIIYTSREYFIAVCYHEGKKMLATSGEGPGLVVGSKGGGALSLLLRCLDGNYFG